MLVVGLGLGLGFEPGLALGLALGLGVEVAVGRIGPVRPAGSRSSFSPGESDAEPLASGWMMRRNP